MPAKTLYFRDKDIWKQIQRHAEAQGIAASALVERILIEYIETHEPVTVCPTCGQVHPAKT